MPPASSIHLSALMIVALAGCTRESRSLGPTPPQSAPRGPNDPRISDYVGNVYQVSQGGRYFSWYGCSGCHDASAPSLVGARLAGGPFDATFRAIADRHGALAYRRRVPVEQLWQLTAFVADLPHHTPEKRRRLAADQGGEPVGPTWSGPLR